jgi:uncharacterized membrane protein
MYTILGSDGKEYGPVSADQLKSWIADNRVNADTPVKMEGLTDWKRVGDLPEFQTASQAAAQSSTATTGSTGTGELDFGGCISGAIDLLKNNFMLCISGAVLIFLVTILINAPNLCFGLIKGMVGDNWLSTSLSVLIQAVTSIVGFAICGPLYGGTYGFFLKILRGESATATDVFAGFKQQHFQQLVLCGVVMGVISFIGLLLCVLPGIYFIVAYVFAPVLVIDRGMPFWDAMELSRQTVTKNWFLFASLLLVLSLMSAAGVLLCFIGLVVTMPLLYSGLMIAYRQVFGD